MNNQKLEVVKRKIELENLIIELKNKYPEVNELDLKTLNAVLTGKISQDYDKALSLDDWRYFDEASIMPIEEINKALDFYDKSSPKLDEIKFIAELADRYNVTTYQIIDRIKDIKKINNYKEKDNENILSKIFTENNVVENVPLKKIGQKK